MKCSVWAALVCGVALALVACRRNESSPKQPSSSSSSFSLDGSVQDSSLIVRDAHVTESSIARWCVRERPHVDIRALDHRGHWIARIDRQIIDETTGERSVLPEAEPCLATREALAFGPHGRALTMVHGRLYVRADEHDAWHATILCSNVEGDPWILRESMNGWVVLGRRTLDTAPVVFRTTDSHGEKGWLATYGLDSRTRSAVLAVDGSFLAVASGAVSWVDQTTMIANVETPWPPGSTSAVSRSPKGLVVFNDSSATIRDVLLAKNIGGHFERRSLFRPAKRRTELVVQENFGRLLAVTREGVEVVEEEGQSFSEMATWPVNSGSDEGRSMNATVSWSANGVVVVGTSRAVAGERCEDLEPAILLKGSQVSDE